MPLRSSPSRPSSPPGEKGTSRGIKKPSSITVVRHERYDEPRTTTSCKWAYTTKKKLKECHKNTKIYQVQPAMVQPSALLHKFHICWFHGPAAQTPSTHTMTPQTLETCPNHPLGGEGYSNLTLPWEQQQATCPTKRVATQFSSICASRFQQVGNNKIEHTYKYITCMFKSYQNILY